MSIIWGRWRPLFAAERSLLRELASGSVLKIGRDLDGRKIHRIHRLDGTTEPVDGRAVSRLRARGLIDSNMKFPAATYLLTDKGQRTVAELTDVEHVPLSSRSYSGQ